MKRKLPLSVILLIELNAILFWITCRDFKDAIHFLAFNSQLNLKGAIDNDVGYSTFLARFFHNKFEFLTNQILSNYLHFWDVNFGVMMFSLVGYIGIVVGFWYLLKSKWKHRYIYVGVLLIIPFIEVFRVFNIFLLRLFILTTPYVALSIYGWSEFLKKYKTRGSVILILLIFLSIWYQAVFQRDLFINCFQR